MKSRTITCLIFAGAFITVYPAAFLLVGSFMGQYEIQENLAPVLSGVSGYAEWSLLPVRPSMVSYIKVLLEEPEFFVTFWNSVKIAAGVLVGQLLFGVPAAWGFACYRFKFRKILFTIYIIIMMMPFQVVMLSQYLVLSNMSLIDTLWSLILPGVFSTFPVFVIYNFFSRIPQDVISAARMDGAGEIRIFISLGLRLGKSGIIAAMILQFFEYWNLVEQPLIFLDSKILWPLTLYLPDIGLAEAGQAFAASVITLIPSVLIFMICRDDIEKGIVASAVKE